MKTTINDIDVSECNIRSNYFKKNICELGNRKLGELHYLCSENPNCYFKQLKQLQKENEELKAGFKELYNNAEQLANKYNKYGGNKENELVEIINKTTDKKNKYKQQIEAYQLSENEAKEIIAELEYKNKDYLKQLDALKPENVYLHQTIKKYKQALEEIRSYCDEQNLKADYTACYITNRIDEVLNNV